MCHRSAYRTLFHFAKSLCRSASRGIERSCALFRRLNELRLELVGVSIPVSVPEIGQDDPIGDVRNAVPRSRWHQKTRQIPNCTLRAAKLRKGTDLILACDFCEPLRLLDACPSYHIIAGVRLTNGPLIPLSRQRKCDLCCPYGHQKGTCPSRRELQALVEMEKHQKEENMSCIKLSIDHQTLREFMIGGYRIARL
jgi:hypothetical protein